MNKIPVIAVVGPTASGKTDLAVKLAKELDGEIISFDSMQIYKGMRIASAAPTEEEREGVRHHLVEFLDPDVSFSVADFVAAATEKVKEIKSRDKAVIIAGGTGLYINSFLDNIVFSEDKIDNELRDELNRQYDALGGEKMLELLKEFDAESADRLHPNNKKRVVRAFEIYRSTGKTMTEQLADSKAKETPYEAYIIGLSYKDRKTLYDRINLRVDKMLEKGLLEEAKTAFDANKGTTSSQAIGHKEFFPFFKGEITLDEAVEELKKQTRRYAKRQLTWFNRDERVNWIMRDTVACEKEAALKILERMNYFGKIK